MSRCAMAMFAIICFRGSLAAAPEQGPQPRVFDDAYVIASLIESLGDTDIEARAHISAALAAYGPKATPSLIVALRDDKAERRAGAAYSLSLMRPPPAEALPGLLQAVKDSEEIVRRQAAYAISRIVRSQPPAVPTSQPEINVPVPDPTPGGRR